jgi:hypothetical protein
MSMSESEGHERQLNRQDDAGTQRSIRGQALPADFSEEDIDFAQALGTLFAPEQEEIPPYFVHTLLESEDPRFQPVEPGFEQKTSARVFRRLKLRRQLFPSHRRSLSTVINGPAREVVRRPLIATAAAVVLFILVTVAFTVPSFASGLAILLHGAHSGVYQVTSYPSGVAAPSPAPSQKNASDTLPRQISLPGAQQLLHFPIYWPGTIPTSYALNTIYLYQGSEESWADGPVLELEYDYSVPGQASHGTGQLMIREFKPKVNVLQVVEEGAAHPIQITSDGQAQAIYVDGQWVGRNGLSFHKWVYGGRSELIYQRDGVVFWIVGDQRDGMNKDTLLNIADSLQLLNLSRIMHAGSPISYVTLVPGDWPGPFAGDVVIILSEDNTDGAYVSILGSNQSDPNQSSGRNMHPH